MDETQRWRRVERLYQEALELPEAQRDPLLARHCEGDAELADEVRSLLASASASEERGFLDTPALGTDFKVSTGGPAASDGGGATDEGLIGERVGPYRILRELASGGMGSVYLASRDDDEFRKRVAVKLVKPGMDSREILLRFRRERQALASLEHPNIARLLDGGTAAGRPYFVMEYIDGEPIDRFCDGRRLTVRGRIQLFRSVCDAVHFAHRNLIVHRDLKPSNVLVGVDGAPKLLDFGVIKLLNPDIVSPTLATSAADARFFTPEYASPEQIRDQSITTASDVYSLGVVLYQLLTGRLPHPARSTSRRELKRSIETHDPLRPSTAVTRPDPDNGTPADAASRRAELRGTVPVALARELAGDLDRIVMRAMAREVDRRYASAAELSEDLARHLRHEPVSAGPPSLRYRLGKFVRRHRRAVVAGSVMLLLVLVALFAVTGLWVRSERAAERAHAAERVEAEANRFLRRVLASARPEEIGRDVRVSEVLDDAAAELDGAFAEEPLVEASLRRTLGVTFERLGQYAKAHEQLDRAITLNASALGKVAQKTLDTRREMASVLLARGELRRALSLATKVLEIHRLELGETDERTLEAAELRALALRSFGRLDEAEALLRTTLDTRRRTVGEEHSRTATTKNCLRAVLLDLGRYDEAEVLVRDALDVRIRRFGPDAPSVLRCRHDLAGVLRARGELEAARDLLDRVIDDRVRILGPSHPETAKSHDLMGRVLNGLDRLDEAEEHYRKGLEIRRDVFGPRGGPTLVSENNLAVLAMARGWFAEAEPILQRLLEGWQETMGLRHPETLRTLGNLGGCLAWQGRWEEAIEMQRRAFDGRAEVFGQDHPDTLKSLNDLAQALFRGRRAEEALPLARRAFDRRSASLGAEHIRTLVSMNLVAEIETSRENWTEAESLLRELVSLRSRGLGEDHVHTLNARKNLAVLLGRTDRHADAEPIYAEVLEALRRRYPDDHPSVRDCVREYARTLNALGKRAEARRLRGGR